MNKLKSFIYLMFSIILVFSVCIPAGAAGEHMADVKIGKPKIDGQIDEVWSYAEEIAVDKVKETGDSPNDGTGANGAFKLLWDNN